MEFLGILASGGFPLRFVWISEDADDKMMLVVADDEVISPLQQPHNCCTFCPKAPLVRHSAVQRSDTQ